MRITASRTVATLLLAIIIVGTISALTVSPASAATTRIYFDPSNNIYSTTTTALGTLFNVTVKVDNVPPIQSLFDPTMMGAAAWQIYVEFNDTILAVTRWYEPKTDPSYLFYGKTTSANPTPPNPGYVHLAPGKGRVSMASNLFPTPPAQNGSSGSGPFTLAVLTFNITRLPDDSSGPLSSSLHFGPADTFLLDVDGNNVPDVILEDGFYEISKPAPPTGSRMFVDPPEIIDPTAVPSVTNFDINVSLDDVANVKTCQFNLTYASSVVSFIGIGFPRVNGQYPVPMIQADDTAGFLWVRLTYSTAITISSPTPVATITFHVRNLGATPLNLTDAQILDPLGTSMPLAVYHGFFAALIRDVAVTSITLSRTWAYAGTPVNVTVTIKNKGNATETFDVSAFYDSNSIGTLTVSGLVPNEERDIVFTWDTTGVAEGNYTIKAVAAMVPFELNTADNTLIDGDIWILTQIHDVAVTNVTLSNSWVFVGYNMKINVTVQNLGVFTETFDVNAYYNSTFLIGTVHVASLAPSETYEAQFIFNTSGLLPCHTYPISGQATAIPYEFNMTNNVFEDGGLKIRLVGDLNGDGKVDVRDIYIVSQAYGSSPGSPRWNPDADINQDLKVDIRDIYLVSRNYGAQC